MRSCDRRQSFTKPWYGPTPRGDAAVASRQRWRRRPSTQTHRRTRKGRPPRPPRLCCETCSGCTILMLGCPLRSGGRAKASPKRQTPSIQSGWWGTGRSTHKPRSGRRGPEARMRPTRPSKSTLPRCARRLRCYPCCRPRSRLGRWTPARSGICRCSTPTKSRRSCRQSTTTVCFGSSVACHTCMATAAGGTTSCGLSAATGTLTMSTCSPRLCGGTWHARTNT